MTASTKIIGFASRPARSSLPPSGARFDRETFVASRLADFTSVKALTAIIGHPPGRWALVVFKELADNGVDNAEADTAAKIIIAVTGRSPALSSPFDKRGKPVAITDPRAVIRLLLKGEHLHLTHTRSGYTWSLSSGKQVADKAAQEVTAHTWVIGCGNGLLPGCDQSLRLKTCSEGGQNGKYPY